MFLALLVGAGMLLVIANRIREQLGPLAEPALNHKPLTQVPGKGSK
jgi:hypothetical protein